MQRTTEDIRENLSFVGCDNETALEMCEEIERLQAALLAAERKIHIYRSFAERAAESGLQGGGE